MQGGGGGGSVAVREANVSSLAGGSSLDPRKQKVQEASSRRIQCRKLLSAERQTNSATESLFSLLFLP